MKKIKWVIILMIFILLAIVIGSFIMDQEEKARYEKYGTPIENATFSYKVGEICSNTESCDEIFEIDNFNGKTIMLNYKRNVSKNIDQLKVDKFVYNAREDTEIDSFGTYKEKYFVIVLKWSTSLTDANREVIYYDKNFNVVADIKLVNDSFDISLSNYTYYSCTIDDANTGAQRYTINVLEIDKDFNFNVTKDSEMATACSTKDGY